MNPAADKFAASNLPTLCVELEKWLASGSLSPNATMRRLANMVGVPVNDPAALEMAKRIVIVQACRVAAQLPAKYGELVRKHAAAHVQLGELQGALDKERKRMDAPPPLPREKAAPKIPPDQAPPLTTEGEEPPSL